MQNLNRSFNYSLDYQTLDLRKHPELYRVGKGEQDVLLVQPYKSAKKIYQLFLDYKAKGDFVGMDMARSLRYYHHKTGKKYLGPVPDDKKGQSGAHGRRKAPEDIDLQKKQSAEIFHVKYLAVLEDKGYIKQRDEFKKKYG